MRLPTRFVATVSRSQHHHIECKWPLSFFRCGETEGLREKGLLNTFREFARSGRRLRSPIRTTVVGLFFSVAALSQVPPPPQPAPNGPAPVLSQPLSGSYSGSVPTGTASPTPLSLSLRDAIRRGLQYNLGVLTNQDQTNIASAERRRALSTLLPSVSAGAMQTSQQIDLVAFGLNITGFPAVVGP